VSGHPVWIFAGVYCRGGRQTGVELLKMVIFHIMQGHLSDILRCVTVCNIYYYKSC